MQRTQRSATLAMVAGLLMAGVANAQSTGATTTGSSSSPGSSLPPTTASGSSTTPSTSTTSGSTSGNSTSRASSSPSQASSSTTSSEPSTPGTSTPRSGEQAPASEPQREDDGRTLDIIFLQAEGGYSYTDLTALSSTGRLLPTLTAFRGSGGGGGLTVGFRWTLLALAAHAYVARFSGQSTDLIAVPGGGSVSMMRDANFDLGQLMAEAHLRIPLPVIEPYIRLGFGYAWLGSFQINEMYASSTSNVHGWTGKAGAGIDIWIGRFFTIGAGVDVSLLNLRRGGVNRTDSTCPNTDPTCIELRMDGDAAGIMVHAHAQLGLHF